MNSDITKAEREKYTEVWKHPQYREESPAYRVRDAIIHALDIDIAHPIYAGDPPRYVFDFGCGTGTMAGYMLCRGYTVIGVDIAANSVDNEFLKSDPRFLFVNSALHEIPATVRQSPVVGGYCVDVMEHIPEPLVDATLNRLSDVCRKVYFRIALFPDHWGETIGVGNLHPTVKPWQWWVSVIADYFSIARSFCEDDPHHGGRVLVVIAEVRRSSDD